MTRRRRKHWSWQDAEALVKRKHPEPVEVSWKWRFDQMRGALNKACRKGAVVRTRSARGWDVYELKQQEVEATQ